MRINSINNNQTSFRSSFVADKSLSLAFREAKLTGSSKFLKSMNKFLNDGEDRAIKLCHVYEPIELINKSVGQIKSFLWIDYPKFDKTMGVDKYVDGKIKKSDGPLAKDFISAKTGCATIEEYFGNIVDPAIDKMSVKDIRSALKAIEEKIFINGLM